MFLFLAIKFHAEWLNQFYLFIELEFEFYWEYRRISSGTRNVHGKPYCREKKNKNKGVKSREGESERELLVNYAIGWIFMLLLHLLHEIKLFTFIPSWSNTNKKHSGFCTLIGKNCVFTLLQTITYKSMLFPADCSAQLLSSVPLPSFQK